MSCSCRREAELVRDLMRHFGETVTIYTTSGGDSGSGFTGVLISVNCEFVRLLSDIGTAPGCALGSCCDKKRKKSCRDEDDFEDDDDERNQDNGRRFNCNGRNTGAVVDIPINRIAAVVHNAL